MNCAGPVTMHCMCAKSARPRRTISCTNLLLTQGRIIVTADRGLPDHVGDRVPPAVVVLEEAAILTFPSLIGAWPTLEPGALVLVRKTGVRFSALARRSAVRKTLVEDDR